MPTTFDEVLIDTAYSAIADGGPEFATAIIRSGEGGSVSSRAETREDYQSKYQVNYGQVEPDRLASLRKFAILRKGMARGFRFLAPDDHDLTTENVGWLNPATGEVEYLAATPASNTLDEFYLIKNYSDPGNAYNRRIIKPSPFDDVVVAWWEDISGTPSLKGTATIAADSAVGAFDAIDTDDQPFVMAAANFTFNFATGKTTSAVPLGDDEVLRVTCVYHLPVAFTDDWQKFKVDEVGLSEFPVGVEELLPIELNIT